MALNPAGPQTQSDGAARATRIGLRGRRSRACSRVHVPRDTAPTLAHACELCTLQMSDDIAAGSHDVAAAVSQRREPVAGDTPITGDHVVAFDLDSIAPMGVLT